MWRTWRPAGKQPARTGPSATHRGRYARDLPGYLRSSVAIRRISSVPRSLSRPALVKSSDADDGVVVALIGLLVCEWHTRTVERKRSQPVVIAHEYAGLQMGDGHWAARVFLTTAGGGSAFNLRLGITMRGVRYAYRLEADDPLGGNRQRVVANGERLPDGNGWFLTKLTAFELVGAAARGKQDAHRVNRRSDAKHPRLRNRPVRLCAR